MASSSAPAPTRNRRRAAAPAALPEFAARFNESDTVLWNIERDPSLRTTIVAVAVLDRVPDWDRLRERIVDATRWVPRLRQRVVPAPWNLGPPHWEDDTRFDIDYHLRRVVVPPPGDLAAVLELATPMAMAAFDKDRPLWEFTLVEGLAGGRAALIEKVHHCFTDGIGGMQLASAFVDEGVPRGRRPGRDRPAEPGDSRGLVPAGLLGPLTDGARTAAAITAKTAQTMPRLAAAAIRDPLRLAEDLATGVRSVARLLRPATSPRSPIMRERGLSRRLEAFDVPLDEALAAAHAAHGTLNDAFLAAVAGGMRRYHERHGTPVSELRVTMPVNLRKQGDTGGNNRFTPVRFTLAVGDDGPAERMRRLGALARQWRSEPALPVSDLIAGALNRLPITATTAVFGSLLKGVDFVATNVPGHAGRVHLVGAEVLRFYAFPPPSGAACGIALVSHGETACIGITIDSAAVPDADALSESLQEGFAEVLGVGKE